MKAIGIKMVELLPMKAKTAKVNGYKVGNADDDALGYEVTYPEGYKSWCPKEVADKAYFKLCPMNDGTKIEEEDVHNFLGGDIITTIGTKTTVISSNTITGFSFCESSSCVDPSNYNVELGKRYAKEKVISKLWEHLGFVLQWAKFGINNN